MTFRWRLASLRLRRRDLLLRGSDLRVVGPRDLVRRLVDPRCRRLAQLVVDRPAVDHLRDRQPDHERDREREREARDREHEVPGPARAEALEDEALDQAVEDGPEREHPQDARDRRAPPLAGGDGHPEAADDRHPGDPHPQRVEETRFARHRPEDEVVTPREPRPPCAHAPTRRRAGQRGVNRLLSVPGRGSTHVKNRRRTSGR